ncbi:ClpX C4-type zinc finger [Aquisphaera giovannonii]|uniref:ClpX C4-type zinc finger n=1 Tax=Aquisphaera giovannonii TaxID=406548 RepID=A0A5B9W0Y4_9BACT|nr:ClpX C4-type zinc finger protein [Aquisphaera giovannonii]QEH34203.1 ClpX C4-type zinc finger [Aquisphaera giovannonii]
MTKDEYCSFCRQPLGETGPIVEGAGTGGVRVFICRQCAELAIVLLDEEVRRRGEMPTKPSKAEVDMIHVCKVAIEHYEALSRQRQLTEVELERKRRVEADLERLKSEGPRGGTDRP